MVEETSSKASEYLEWMPLRALDLNQLTLLQNVLRPKLTRSLRWVSLSTPCIRTRYVSQWPLLDGWPDGEQ